MRLESSLSQQVNGVIVGVVQVEVTDGLLSLRRVYSLFMLAVVARAAVVLGVAPVDSTKDNGFVTTAPSRYGNHIGTIAHAKCLRL